MAQDPLSAHKEWIGYLQPVGLVVSPHALLAAQAIVSEQVSEPQQRLRALPRPFPFTALATELLGGAPVTSPAPPAAPSSPTPSPTRCPNTARPCAPPTRSPIATPPIAPGSC